MKRFFLLSAFATLLLSNSDCKQKKEAATTKYKGRLETKGICLNYTISLIEGEMDTSMVTEEWTDEFTNITYENVFALSNPCRFPASIKKNDEFYFEIDTAVSNCEVCLAYYPIPPKKLLIKVVDQ